MWQVVDLGMGTYGNAAVNWINSGEAQEQYMKKDRLTN